MTQKEITEKVYIEPQEAQTFFENGQIQQELFIEARKKNIILDAFNKKSELFLSELFKKYTLEDKQVIKVEKDEKGTYFVVAEKPKEE